jgi:hypothetical protein
LPPLKLLSRVRNTLHEVFERHFTDFCIQSEASDQPLLQPGRSLQSDDSAEFGWNVFNFPGFRLDASDTFS